MDWLISQVSSNSNSTDFWRDGAWQSIGVIATITGVIVSLFIFFRQRQIKSFSYEVISNLPILNVNDEYKADMEIKFKGNLIQNLHLVVIRFFNSGNISIERKDYDKSVEINFGNQAQLLSIDTIDQIPSNLGIILSSDKKTITIQPTLMNKGDSFTIKALVASHETLSIDGRISGIQRIQQVDIKSNKKFNPLQLATIVALSLFAGFLTSLSGYFGILGVFIFMILMILGYIFYFL